MGEPIKERVDAEVRQKTGGVSPIGFGWLGFFLEMAPYQYERLTCAEALPHLATAYHSYR
jgi:hypothetical protein